MLAARARSRSVARFPRNVLLLAATSFLADVSGEMLMAVLPFLLVAQGATGVGVGLVGGLADAVGHLVKPLAGRLADRLRRRKPLILTGYAVPALARIGIALASTWGLSLLFRATDRVGKGLRSAPRDALLAESVPREQRGRAFGLHRAADTAGAFVGVALALCALVLLHASPAGIVLAGAFIGLGTLVPLLFVRDLGQEEGARTRLVEPASPRYRAYLLVAALFALGNVSYLFFLLRAADAVGGEAGAIALYLLFNLVYFLAAYPAGHLADRWGKPRVLLGAFLLFALACAVFLLPPTLPAALAGFVVLGFAFAGFEGTERAFAADLAGTEGRATRLGLFHGTVGLATFAGGIAAGLLWDRVAPWAAFGWGAGLALGAALLLVTLGFARAPETV
jgi:MFS family permease